MPPLVDPAQETTTPPRDRAVSRAL